MGQVFSYFLAESEEYTSELVECPPSSVCSVTDKKSLFLKNIPKRTDRSFLEYHIDKVSGLSTNNGDYELISREECLYIVNFRSDIGSKQFHDIKTKICRTKFNGADIKAEELLPTRSVIISNIDETKRNQEYLERYFSDPKKCRVNGFDSIELLEDGQVLVHFEDSESVKDLLKTTHFMLGVKAELQPYDKLTVLIESHSIVNHIDKEVPRTVAKFALKCESNLSTSLESMHATIKFTINDDSENGFIHITSVKGSENDINWKEKCQDYLEQFLRSVSYSTLTVQPEILQEVQKMIQRKQFNLSICIELINNQTTLHIAGYTENVESFAQEFQCIVDTELPKEELITLSAAKFAYIDQTQIGDLKKHYPAVRFTIDTDCNTITVIGNKKDRESFMEHLNKIKVAIASITANQQILDVISGLEDLTIINKLLHNQKEQFAIFIDEEGKVYTVASEKNIASKLAKYTKQMIYYTKITNCSNMFEEEHFTELREQLKAQCIVDVIISPSEIEIIGEKKDVIKVERKLKEHIHKRYYQQKKIEINHGYWRFVSEKLSMQWNEIIGKCKTDPDYINVKVTQPKAFDINPEIILEGEESIIVILHDEIRTLIKNIFTNKPPLIIIQPGLFEFLTEQEEGKFIIKGIEDNSPCCIEVTSEVDSTAKEICEGTTKEGKKVILVEGNIECFKVDVIVNAANKHLKHAGGVALALSKKGGSKIQIDSDNYTEVHGDLLDGEAIMRDEVGDLPCKKIIHAIGPRWKNDGKVEELLMKACINSLKLANKYKTIAFPAICSGIFQFPVEISAATMIQAFCTWSGQFPDVPLHTIYVVVHSHAVLTFTNVIKKLTIAPQQINMGIQIYRGGLLDQQAEVYVNTTSAGLILSNGEVSKSILKAGGQTVQDECKQHVSTNGNVQAGNIVVTGPGNIPCKLIIHTVGANYDSSNASKSRKMLEKTVEKCLKECEHKGAHSIAFPALGADNLDYPPKVVAEVMITTVQSHYKTNPTSCIKEVKFVIFKDDTYTEFERVLSECSELSNDVNGMPGQAQYHHPISSTTVAPDTLSSKVTPTRVRRSPTTSIATIPIKLYKGELLKQQAEVYVNTTSAGLILSNGEVSKSILKAGGQTVQDECKQHVSTNGNVQAGNIAVTGPGNIPCKLIIHTVGANYDSSNASKSRKMLEKTVEKCLKECEHKGAHSIAFPALGAGNLGYPPKVVAEVMITTVQSHYKTNPTSCIKEVKFVIFKDDTYKEFERVLSECSELEMVSNDAYNVPEESHQSPFSSSMIPTPGMLSSEVTPTRVRRRSPTISITTIPMKLYKGELLEQQAEVYVNTTSSDLILSNGEVSKSILKAGGQTVQDECKQHVSTNGNVQAGDIAVTGPGNIPCKLIIHTVGANYDSSNASKSRKILEKTVEKCLKECEHKGAHSIAFPALGAGNLGYPPKVVAEVMITTVQSHYKTNPTSCIKEIKFVIFKDDTYKEFERVLSECSKLEMVSNNAYNVPEESHQSPFSSSMIPTPGMLSSKVTPIRARSGSSTSIATIPIKLYKGELLKQQAEVYVNTTSSGLILSNGEVSKSILKAGGQTVQDECKQYVSTNGNVQAGNIAVTKPGNIPCKLIIHTVGTNYDSSNASKSRKMLKETVEKCLKECEHKGAHSIAFPALGAGNLGYPPKVVAEVMITTVQSHYKTNPTSCIKEVKFVIFKDDTYKEFEGFLSQLFISIHSIDIPETLPYISPPHNSTASYNTTPSSFAHRQLQSLKTFKAGEVVVEIVHGDITDDSSDIIVNTTQSNLQLATGTVSRAILGKAGTIMQQNCQMYIEKHEKLTEGEIYITEATGQLRCKVVFHIAVSNTKKFIKISQAVTTCLKEADSRKLKSIAFPAIGTGGLSYDSRVAAHGMYEAIVNFGQAYPLYLQLIRIVIFKKEMHQIFVQKFTELSTKQPQASALTQCCNTMSSVVRKFLPSNKKVDSKVKPVKYFIPETSAVQINVYAMTPKGVQNAEESLKYKIAQRFTTLSIKNYHISTFNPDQISELTQKAAEHHVMIEVDLEKSEIQIKGRKDDAKNLEAAVNDTLHTIDQEALKNKLIAREAQLKREQNEKEIYSSLQRIVTWKYPIDDKFEDYEEYDAKTNYNIEQAYQLYITQGKPSVFTYISGDQYEISFESPMEEKNCTSGEKLKIQRIDVIKDMASKAEFPGSWGSNYDKFQIVSLNSNDEEYIKVKQGFEESVKGKNIHKIERIQNPTLYAQYITRKKRMDQENPPGKVNERRLYHGCAGKVVKEIAHNGFNRIFAGEHGVAFGSGVYFAVKADYSTDNRYSKPDSDGSKYIFLARVLTGEYTKGDPSFKTPPAKDPKNNALKLYDSVVNSTTSPIMFVVFYDAQCYPEYLITFK